MAAQASPLCSGQIYALRLQDLCAFFRKPALGDPPRMQITTRLDLIEQAIGINQPQGVGDQHTERPIGAVGLLTPCADRLRRRVRDMPPATPLSCGRL